MKKAIALLLVTVCAFLCAVPALSEGEPVFVTIREWLDAKGECGNCMLLVRIRTILNPVLAEAEDETGTVNLFSANGEDSFIIPFMGEGSPAEGDMLVIANPRYNVFEGTVEMADWTLLRWFQAPRGE